jgi:hypothetical protein
VVRTQGFHPCNRSSILRSSTLGTNSNPLFATVFQTDSQSLKVPSNNDLSSNGRTADFESVNCGSNPCRSA